MPLTPTRTSYRHPNSLTPLLVRNPWRPTNHHRPRLPATQTQSNGSLRDVAYRVHITEDYIGVEAHLANIAQLSPDQSRGYLSYWLQDLAPIWASASMAIGGMDQVAQLCRGDHLEYIFTNVKPGDGFKPVEFKERQLSSSEFKAWLTDWMLLSCLSEQLERSGAPREYLDIRAQALNQLLAHYTPVSESACAARALAAKKALPERKASVRPALLLTIFRMEPRLIDDLLWPQLLHPKNLKHTPQLCALIKNLEEWQAFAPSHETLSESMARHFDMPRKPSRKSIAYATAELPYQLKYGSAGSGSAPSEERAAFYHWANQAMAGDTHDLQTTHTFVKVVETGHLRSYRFIHRGESPMSTQQLMHWERQLTQHEPGREIGWRSMNTADPLEITKASRYTKSCLNVYRDQRSAQYYLGRFIDPHNRQLQIYQGQGFVGRAMLRIIADKNQGPALYLDKAYFSDDNNAERNKHCIVELLHRALQLGQEIHLPLVVHSETLSTLDEEAWRTTSRSLLTSKNPLQLPDYYDGDVGAGIRPQRGRLKTGEFPKLTGFHVNQELVDYWAEGISSSCGSV